MSNETELRSALTAEEWKSLSTCGADCEDVLADDWCHITNGCVGIGASLTLSRPHAVAALCLHAQPFGFTRSDVDEIMRAAVRADNDGLQGIGFNLRGIATCIAALLPPHP